MKQNILKLHELDNVAILTVDVEAGQELITDGFSSLAIKSLSLGDKIALSNLVKGQQIFKYGLAIGSTKEAVKKGQWVHLHNMQSDYVATYVFNGSDQES